MELKVSTKKKNKTVVKDYGPVLSEAQYDTSRMDSPGKFTFSLIENSGIDIEMGSQIQVKIDKTEFFKGYVFSAERSRNKKVKYTAYDQFRYLKAKASYTFVAMDLAGIITQIAGDFGLKVGTLANTGYKFPSLIKENESCMDIIYDALAETIIQTGKIYIIYDDFGKITLKEAKQHIYNRMIGDKSLLGEYTYKRSIDSDTYNVVKLARPNKDTGKADTFIYKDSDTIKDWGVLQYYETVDENLNNAQIEEMCKTYIKYYNRVWQSLKLKNIIGQPKVRAGWIIPVMIGDIDATNVQRYFLAEKVVHKFSGNSHTMEIEVKNFNDLGVA